MSNVTLESIMDKLNSIEFTMDSLKQSVDKCNEKISTCTENQESILPRIEKLEKDMAVVKREVTSLKEKNIQLDSKIRKDNLIFGGLSESEPDDTENKIRLFIQNVLKIDTSNMKFSQLYRMGKKQQGKDRSIFVRFHFFGDRMQVWKSRKSLKETSNWIAEDFPTEIQERRRILKIILRRAYEIDTRSPGDIDDIYLVADRLFIGGVTYTVGNLDSLPQNLRPENFSTPEIGDRVVAFYNELSPLSNFYPAKFTCEGIEYSHVEQFFCAKKAELTNRPDVKETIMQQVSPLKCKTLAKNLPLTLEWKRNQEEIMAIGCEAKFRQNTWLSDFLKKTGEKSLVETRKDDKFWGAGVAHDDPQIMSDKYPGKNKLGKILMDIRAKLE